MVSCLQTLEAFDLSVICRQMVVSPPRLPPQPPEYLQNHMWTIAFSCYFMGKFEISMANY